MNNSLLTPLYPPPPVVGLRFFENESVVLKTSVATLVTIPFCLSTLNILLEHSFIVGLVMTIEATPCIFRLGYLFYGQHVKELFSPQESMEHIAHHLSGDQHAVPRWSLAQKAVVGILIMACTLPLGITKVGLSQASTSVEMYEKLGYLFIYSMIDALPHINHLPFWSLAFKKFFSLPWYFQAWVLTLMSAHALNDVADVWNSSGMLTYWVYLGLATEFFISAVEAVAHYRPISLRSDPVSIMNLLVIMLGATNIALLNWYNTFGERSVSLASTSQCVFILLEILATVFFAVEIWNHYAEPKECHDDPDEEIERPSSNGVSLFSGSFTEQDNNQRFSFLG